MWLNISTLICSFHGIRRLLPNQVSRLFILAPPLPSVSVTIVFPILSQTIPTFKPPDPTAKVVWRGLDHLEWFEGCIIICSAVFSTNWKMTLIAIRNADYSTWSISDISVISKGACPRETKTVKNFNVFSACTYIGLWVCWGHIIFSYRCVKVLTIF